MLEADGGGATKWELKGTCLLLISNEKEKEGNRNEEGKEHHTKYMYKAPSHAFTSYPSQAKTLACNTWINASALYDIQYTIV